MEKNIMPVLTPDFYKDFHCVASACRASCCVHPWIISIDKKNYKQLRKLKEPKWLTESFSGYIKRSDNSKSDSEYAYVVYGEHGCAMQTEDGLCRLQMDAGAQYLSITCQKYPRLVNVIRNGDLSVVYRENCLATSCEEVVRILLHKPEPILFESTTEQFHYGMTGVNSNIHIDKRPIMAHYHRMRAVCIALLQNRDYHIEQRLMLLVLYMDKIAQAEQNSAENTIPTITDTFIAAVEEKLYDGMLAANGGGLPTAIMSNITFANAFAKCAQHPTIQQCDTNITAHDNAVRTASYRAFIADKEHFLEHLLVMELFGKVLPFHKPHSIMENAQYLVSVFSILRFTLGAYLGENHDLPENEFIDFVAFFGKTTLHDRESFDRNIALLKNNGMDTLPYLLAIVLG